VGGYDDRHAVEGLTTLWYDFAVNQALSALERTVLPGTRLGRYEIITHLAAGGMATVFLGRALGAAGFHRLVAIKLLHPHVAADQQFTTMFLDEARLAARIRHPNVVPTLDLQHGPEGPYLVMEFVEGESLLGLLRQTVKVNKPMPAGIAIRVVLDALHGLHAAHELKGDIGEPLNLVHRDVSPHNILVGVDGVARIVDFGIARAEERIGTTRDGQVKGKLAYMAPEQSTSDPVDRRVDVFTAGIVLWESLTGRRLFRGQTDAEVLRNLLEKPIPRLREVSPGYPQALEDVCARALNRDRDERFDTAAEFAEELEKAAEGLGIATPKQVSAYVKDVAGEEIESMMRRVRAFQEGAKVTPASAMAKKLELAENADSSVRATSAPMAKDILAQQEVTRSRRPLVIGIGAMVLVLVGAIVATITLLVASQGGKSDRHAVATSPAKTQTATQTTATTATAPLDSSETISITDLPRANEPHANRPQLPRRPTAPPSATTVTTAPATATATAKPTSTAFNPESM
jgi:serine/threonine-protein kinase